jgi:hypothetical protein
MFEQVAPAGSDLSGWVAEDGQDPWVLGLAVAGTALEMTRWRTKGDEQDEARRLAVQRLLALPRKW